MQFEQLAQAAGCATPLLLLPYALLLQVPSASLTHHTTPHHIS